VQAETPATRKESIAPKTGVGAVELAVTDGARAATFYEELIGLRRLGWTPHSIRLGVGDRELVVLHPGASTPVLPRRTGLYHLALLVPTRHDLAVVVRRLATSGWEQSPTDHVMTKSDYLWDPDGNGIEIYTETPEDGDWFFDDKLGFAARDVQGRLRSGRDAIDLNQLFSNLRGQERLDQPLPAATRMGHVHLHVSNLDDAVAFYCRLVGFELMGISRAIGMAFVSAGGYHHHIGLNTWAGEGAPAPPEGSRGLRDFEIVMPRTEEVDELERRLKESGAESRRESDALHTRDPSGNGIAIRSAG
jgi:catechol 2,3-dioxygenase